MHYVAGIVTILPAAKLYLFCALPPGAGQLSDYIDRHQTLQQAELGRAWASPTR